PEENIYVVGNSVVDAIEIKRKNRSPSSVFDIYPILGTQYTNSNNNNLVRQEWIRVDIHRRENLTERRFMAIIKAVIQLVEIGYRVVLIKLTATEHALLKYGLVEKLDNLAQDHPHNFVQTALWKDYGHVIEFLDSEWCWLELTDSGSMQEELLYFPNVASVTVRLNTDRPETVFDAMDNILAPPSIPNG
ncbi:MAG: UDP-N-acetylglucosamine 2-epimerase, partial [Nitrososphaeraceae archaeon]